MIKGFVILFNLLGLFLCKLFFPVSVTVTQTAPSSAEINNSFLVQVAINKGDLNGVAKFTEQLPPGFNAVPIDNEGAKTSFDNNTIQFSWDSIPASGILNISFRVDVTPAAIAQGDLLIGRFLYTVDNQKLEADCDPSNITITNGSAVQASSANQNSNTSQVNNIQQSGAEILQSNGSTQNKVPSQVDNIYIGSGGVYIVRQFPSLSISPNSDAAITLIIHKTNITGFAKIEDSIPNGFIANGIVVSGASFTFVNNVAKFVWQTIPSDSILTISYRLSAGPGINGTYAISGNFSYIYNGSPAVCSIGNTSFQAILSIPEDSYAVTQNKTPADSNTIISTAKPTDTENNQPAQSTNTTPMVEKTAATAATTATVTANNAYKPADNTENNQPLQSADVTPSIPAPSGGINYRVQIMALHTPVNVSYFSSKKKLKVHVNTESNEGFTKYTVGNYVDYKSVRDAREDIKNKNIKDPFVVSYNSGVRITVQEALMISHQQWYK